MVCQGGKGMSKKVIEIEHLTKDYGDHKGVFDISFTIQEGEVFGFLGPNGAGKTTAIRHLMGFLHAKEGICKIQGKDCGSEAAAIQKNVGYIPGEINLLEDMTGMQFLHFMWKYRGMKKNGRMDELIQRFELDPKGKIKKMSKGMKQKIAIISAFMHDPKILILDEPTSGLDPLMQMKFVELILEEKEKGKSILMSSHIFEEIEKTCNRVGIIKNGMMVSVETIENFKKVKTKLYRLTFSSQEEADTFCSGYFHTRRCSSTCVEVSIQDDLQNMINAMYGMHVIKLDEITQSLEEIFMQFYGGESHDEHDII